MKKRDLLAVAMVCVSAALLIGACQGMPQQGPGMQGQGPGHMMAGPGGNQMGGPSGQGQSFESILNTDAQRKWAELDARAQQQVIDQVNQGTEPNSAVNAVYSNPNRQSSGAQGGRPPAPGARPLPPGSTGPNR